jgi:hypothetical protein
VPDWLLTVPRALWTPVTGARRWLRKWHADRQALVREGSEIVTRVQQYVESLGPASLVWGTNEQAGEYLEERRATWNNDLRWPLRTYVNLHPSDDVVRLGHELEQAVGADLSATIYLLMSRQSAEAQNAYVESDRAHGVALEQAQAMMDEIRRY